MTTVATVADEDRVRPLERCLACDGDRLQLVVDLGAQPLANDYHDGSVKLARFPLAVNVCPDCFHSQLTHAVDADLLFRNYLYVSGTTKTLLESFDEFVDEVEREFPARPLRVLDIASNDGTLLSRFAKRGHEVLGVDPAENLRPLSEELGVPTHVGYWNEGTAQKLAQQFDVIVAMNVLAHVPYPHEFLSACRTALRPGGRIYIQTSQCEMIERFEFDTIYHEHHSFFTARSFRALADRANLTLVAVEKVPVHGTSYRFSLTAEQGQQDPSVSRLMDYETTRGYYDIGTYRRFGAAVAETVAFVRQTVSDYQSRGHLAVGYGAAAKGNTMLNMADVGLKYIVDDNPLKIGMLTPGTDTPIVPSTALADSDLPLCIVVLAWNFYDEIRERVWAERQHQGDVFVRYFPVRQVTGS